MTTKAIDRKACILCGKPLSGDPLLTLKDMPASAQDIPDAQEVEQDHGITLQLCQCTICGLVQFECEPVGYYKDVIRAGGFSTTMVELRRRQYEHLIYNYHLEGKRFLEVGCGRGEFLNVLMEYPVEGYGMEHKADLVEIARAQGLKVCQGFIEDEDTKPFDVFLSFNFLEHQPDPGKMLQCIYRNLTADGMGLITVPSLEYILENDGYYELIRDHLAYYTFDTLTYLLQDNGFEVLEQEMVNRDTLSVIVKKNPRLLHEKSLHRQLWQVDLMEVSGLKQSAGLIEAEINALVETFREKDQKLALWGAGHQGFTLAATTKLGDKVSYIIDSAPFKQGRFAPASHIPIVSPEYYYEHPVQAILIIAPGYSAEIAGIIRERYGNQVQILTLRSNHIEVLDLPVPPRRIVVTGATGFLGRNLVNKFLQQGDSVYALVRPESAHSESLPVHERLKIVRCGLLNAADCVEEIGRADAFFHFAWGGVNREEIDSPIVQADNVAGSLACIKAAHLLGCEVFMDAGSRVEYGVVQGAMSEEAACNPVNEYGKAKWEFYQSAEPLCREYGLTYYHLRFFSVYGYGDHPWSIISTLIRELRQDHTVSLSACRHLWNFMYINDAIDAVYTLYKHSGSFKGETNIVNIASRDTRQLRSFVEEVKTAAGGRGALEYGSFVQAKEGSVSLTPVTERLDRLTSGEWKENYTFFQGILETIKKEVEQEDEKN